MAEVFKQKILKLLKHRDYKPVKVGKLAKALGVSSEDYPQFKEAFDHLRRAGHVVIGSGSRVSLAAMSGRIIGRFRANARGFGFVTPLEVSSRDDLFIPPNATANAMAGDIVAATVVKQGKRGGQMRYSGRVVEILERANNRFVGTLVKKAGGWIVVPDGTGFLEPISVEDVGAKGAKAKDKVVVEILTYPTEKYQARGVIIEVLGKAGQYESEISSIIHQYHLPGEFDGQCRQQASGAARDFDAEKADGREDITDKTIITIDPPDAKDFDDAISLETDGDGNWQLGVHIADVSNFIPADSVLDIEAKSRGNSVYLPGRTIPMLPEVLSNGICSLQPGQKRFAKSVYITYDGRGNILGRRFANSVMCSTQRLTYRQAEGILKGRTGGISSEVAELLKNMERLSRVIEKRRDENGMLHLDLPETELIFDKSGRVVDAQPADDSYPHTMIEMFMVEANEAVAGLFDGCNIAFMRRIHPEPDSLSMKNLAKLVRTLGYGLRGVADRAAMQELLNAVKGTDCSLAVNLMVLRSLEKAEYSPLKVGHYALGSVNYCHFTSPIRRYADLMVHRLLEKYLRAGKEGLEEQADLAETGKHITFTEQRAEDAENELRAVLTLQMLSGRIGEELDCVVTGVTSFGVFAQCKKFGIEGLIKTEDLGGDEWKYNQRSQCIMGQRSGVSIGLGRAMRVRIVSVNVPARQLDICPVEPVVSADKKVTKKKRARKNTGRRIARGGKRRR